MVTLTHSTSALRSRTVARSVASRSRPADSATSPALCETRSGSSPPTWRGQNQRSWRSAAAWKVRACTPAAPRSRSRVRISPAARAVNVTASTRCGT